ncbi:uncharacterized protein LOC125475320 [Pyrus x bretschneideri]|uniref:uncharacterized protein LOC125475320 n=1 Tax=Pyrus x bretschneideri TaxID=225117 RepID=UPI00202FA807|nr:uncharacterized protein LOC125475320 [Pyrus x bretschneideri]
MNDLLLAEYSDFEINEALFQMEPHTALRPDGMPSIFFQKFWPIVGNDVICAVKSFLSSRRILKELNYTHVSLISKLAKVQNITQLRLIALCNVLYKMGAKVLVNHLKSILDQIISKQQGAFFPGRMISNNFVIASEPGFAASWVETVKNCVSPISYFFLVNGKITGYMSPHLWSLFGQRTNLQKSAVSFSPNVYRAIQDQLVAYLGVPRVDVHDKYLGLQIVIGHSHSAR